MPNPPDQSPTPEHPVTPAEWIPPQLDKLPIADTAIAFVGNIADGVDFSS